jgi:hypothetical protein
LAERNINFAEFEREIQNLSASFSQATKMVQPKRAGGVLMADGVRGHKMKDFDDVNERLLTDNNQTQADKSRKIKDPVSSRITEKLKLAAKQLTFNNQRGLQMLPLEKIRLPT